MENFFSAAIQWLFADPHLDFQREPKVVAYACPHCHGSLSVGVELAAQVVACPLCKKNFRMPPIASPAEAVVENVAFDFSSSATRRPSARKSPPARVDDSMNLFLGIGGSVALLIGSFCPVISLPIVGGLSYLSAISKQLQNGSINDIGISALLVLASCAASFSISFARIFSMLWLTAGAAMLAVGITMYGFISLKSKMESEMPNLRDNPFAGLARAAAEAIQPDFGLAIVLVGAGLLVAAAVVAPRRR